MRELAERGVLRGTRGTYASTVNVAEVSMPATVQATIAARIDRLDAKAKRTLNAAAVIGSKFSRNLLDTLGDDLVLDDLVGAQFLDQITVTGDPAYVFHHPLIRAVAYESQLKSDRAVNCTSESPRRSSSVLRARSMRTRRLSPSIWRRGRCTRRLRVAHARRQRGWPTATSVRRRSSWQRAQRLADGSAGGGSRPRVDADRAAHPAVGHRIPYRRCGRRHRFRRTAGTLLMPLATRSHWQWACPGCWCR